MHIITRVRQNYQKEIVKLCFHLYFSKKRWNSIEQYYAKVHYLGGKTNLVHENIFDLLHFGFFVFGLLIKKYGKYLIFCINKYALLTNHWGVLSLLFVFFFVFLQTKLKLKKIPNE